MKRLLILLALLPTVASALEVTVTWDAVTDARVQGYNAYCSTDKTGPWTKIGTVPGIASTSLKALPCVATGVAYFTVRSYGTGGAESANSNIAQGDFTAPTAPVVPACPVVEPVIQYVVQQYRSNPDRPLYGDDFIAIGRVEYLDNGQPRACEQGPIVVKPGTATEYRYTTNGGGLRGLTICVSK